MHHQAVTAPGFCLEVLLRKNARTLVQLVKAAEDHRIRFDEFQIRRAIKTLIGSQYLSQAYGNKSPRLKYSLTAKGKLRAQNNRRLMTKLFQIEDEKDDEKEVKASVQEPGVEDLTDAGRASEEDDDFDEDEMQK